MNLSEILNRLTQNGDVLGATSANGASRLAKIMRLGAQTTSKSPAMRFAAAKAYSNAVKKLPAYKRMNISAGLRMASDPFMSGAVEKVLRGYTDEKAADVLTGIKSILDAAGKGNTRKKMGAIAKQLKTKAPLITMLGDAIKHSYTEKFGDPGFIKNITKDKVAEINRMYEGVANAASHGRYEPLDYSNTTGKPQRSKKSEFTSKKLLNGRTALYTYNNSGLIEVAPATTIKTESGNVIKKKPVYVTAHMLPNSLYIEDPIYDVNDMPRGIESMIKALRDNSVPKGSVMTADIADLLLRKAKKLGIRRGDIQVAGLTEGAWFDNFGGDKNPITFPKVLLTNKAGYAHRKELGDWHRLNFGEPITPSFRAGGAKSKTGLQRADRESRFNVPTSMLDKINANTALSRRKIGAIELLGIRGGKDDYKDSWFTPGTDPSDTRVVGDLFARYLKRSEKYPELGRGKRITKTYQDALRRSKAFYEELAKTKKGEQQIRRWGARKGMTPEQIDDAIDAFKTPQILTWNPALVKTGAAAPIQAGRASKILEAYSNMHPWRTTFKNAWTWVRRDPKAFMSEAWKRMLINGLGSSAVRIAADQPGSVFSNKAYANSMSKIKGRFTPATAKRFANELRRYRGAQALFGGAVTTAATLLGAGIYGGKKLLFGGSDTEQGNGSPTDVASGTVNSPAVNTAQGLHKFDFKELVGKYGPYIGAAAVPLITYAGSGLFDSEGKHRFARALVAAGLGGLALYGANKYMQNNTPS